MLPNGDIAKRAGGTLPPLCKAEAAASPGREAASKQAAACLLAPARAGSRGELLAPLC